MSGYLGSWKIDDLLTFTVVTTRVDTGAATDADAAPAYRVYEDETATPILTGTMALLDSANTAGFYSEQITLSAANGFEKGKSYNIYISATVNGVAGATVRNLQIEAEVDAHRINWANVDNPTTTVGLSGTTVKDATDVNTDTDLLLSRVGTPSNLGGGATLSANLSDIEGQTDDIGAAGAGLTAVPWNAGWDAEVQSEVQDALEANNLDHLVKIAVDTNFATTVHADSVVGQMADNGAGFDRSTDSLEAIRDRGDAAWITATGFSTHSAADVWAVATRALTDKAGFSLSAAGIQAVWDALTTALTTVGSIGKLLVDNINATISSRATQTSVDTVDDFLDTEIAAIKAKTDNLPADPADASDIAASFSTLNTKVDTVDDFLDTEIAAIIAAIAALPTANQNADALLDRAAGVETNRTVRQAMRLILAAVAGKLSGAATNQVTIRDTNDGVNRIVATVDADGNRTAVTLDAS